MLVLSIELFPKNKVINKSIRVMRKIIYIFIGKKKKKKKKNKKKRNGIKQ
jgi:hypothetical protein